MSAPCDLTLTWLGHACVVIDLAGTRVMTDPLLRRHNGPLRRRGPQPRPEQWAGTDLILISHLHHDHAELSSLRMLPGVTVGSAPQNVEWLRRKGISGAHDLSEAWQQFGSVEVRQVPADHHDRPMPHRPGAAHGHLVRAGGRTVHVVGDSDLTDGMSSMTEWAGGPIDVVLVPIAGWGPKLSEGHLNPERAAIACARIGARWAMPYHSGTLYPPVVGWFGDWLDRPLREFSAALAVHAPDTRLAPIAGQAGVAWQVPVVPHDTD